MTLLLFEHSELALKKAFDTVDLIAYYLKNSYYILLHTLLKEF